MSAIFSVQNLQTFLRRKNFRPPSRSGPPGPDRPPPPPPPNRGRSPPPERSPKGREGGAVAAGALVSSVITLLHISRQISVLGSQKSLDRRRGNIRRRCVCCRCRRLFRACRGLRAHFLLRVAQSLDLRQPLMVLVNPHGEELDHLLSDAQAPLQFVDHRSRAFNRHQNVNALAEFANGIGQAPLAHAVYRLHSSGGWSHGGF